MCMTPIQMIKSHYHIESQAKYESPQHLSIINQCDTLAKESRDTSVDTRFNEGISPSVIRSVSHNPNRKLIVGDQMRNSYAPLYETSELSIQ